MRSVPRSTWLLLAVVLLASLSVGVFLVDVDASEPEPAAFDDTVSMGLSLEDEYTLADDVELPRVQAYHSQYEYVVGYYGVETYVTQSERDGYEAQFGYPLAVYVTDYSDTQLELNDEGYPTTDDDVEWTDGEDAYYVIDSDARSPHGETVLPFSDRSEAVAFAEQHDGTVLEWDDVLETSFGPDDASLVRDRVDDQHREANETVEQRRESLERPETVTVDSEAETIQAVIDDAPPGSTVVVPDGTYEETLEIDEPITLVGEDGARLDGDGNEAVIEVRADDVAVTGFEITGVGTTTEGTDDLPDHEPDDDSAPDDWDDDLVAYFGDGDAGVLSSNADRLLVEDVSVETPSNGVALRNSSDTVVRNVTVEGSDSWRDGMMGVLAVHSDGVVEGSEIAGGRDGVYTHRSSGIVVRENTIVENRIGVHLMHTSDALIADNDVSSQDSVGIYVMTGPERNAIVDNVVRDTETGINPDGSDSYVAGNVLEGNDLGFRTDARASIYEHNVLAGNIEGVQARSLVPSNRVVDNDFVGNYEHANAGPGPLRVWTHDGTGNYWQGAVGTGVDETLERAYTPTDQIDQRLHRVHGTPTLAQAPAGDALGALEGAVPGMRTESVVDTAPRCEPANPELLATTDWDVAVPLCDTNE